MQVPPRAVGRLLATDCWKVMRKLPLLKRPGRGSW